MDIITIDASHSDLIFVFIGSVLSAGDNAPDPGYMPLKQVLSGSTKPFQESFPSMCHIFPSRFSLVVLFKTVSTPLGFQVPVPFKTFESCLQSTSCRDHLGACLYLATCPHRGHLALHSASTIRFSTLMLPILTLDLSQPNMARVLLHYTFPASSRSLVI
jgi:hypothetical protein